MSATLAPATPVAPHLMENVARAQDAWRAKSSAAVADRIEGLTTCAVRGDTRQQAVQAAGFPSLAALQKFCSRHGRLDLLARLPLERSTR